ncbi:MAG: hypothetical protein PBU42_06025 [Acinetobacter haemolyticus]
MKKIYMLGFICGLSACQSSYQEIQQQPRPKLESKHTIPKVILQEKRIPSSYLQWAMQAQHQQQIQAYKNFLCTRQISQNPYPIRILPS